MGITDPDRVYGMEDMARGDVLFAATGVTDGNLLSGVRFDRGSIQTHTIVMRSSSRTVREIKAGIRIRTSSETAPRHEFPAYPQVGHRRPARLMMAEKRLFLSVRRSVRGLAWEHRLAERQENVALAMPRPTA